MSKTIIVTGASIGIGALSASALADAGHTMYVGLRETAGRNADGRAVRPASVVNADTMRRPWSLQPASRERFQGELVALACD